MGVVLRRVLIHFLSLLNYMMPKANVLTFCSLPDYADNGAAFFDYVVRQRPKQYRYVWLLKWGNIEETQRTIEERHPGVEVTCVAKDSWKGVYYFCKSRYLFFTHGIYGHVAIPKRQRAVHLSHGMPIKKFWLVDCEKPPQCSYILATSTLFTPVFSEAFQIENQRVLPLGTPRNDLVFTNHHLLEKLGIDATHYQKIILWVPTYRIPIVAALYETSAATTFDSAIPLVSRSELCDFNEFLAERGLLCLFKPHPLSPMNPTDFAGLSHILLIGPNTLRRMQADIHQLLFEIDVLLTDYSSIYFDYLLLDRPIGFIHEDLEVYSKDLGFAFHPVDEWMPGAKISSLEDLKAFLEGTVNEEDAYADARASVRKRAHQYEDDNSRRRLLAFLDL